MNPQERADKLMTDFMSAEIHEAAVALIARHIRDAENDALERAALRVPSLQEYRWLADEILALKHVQ